MNQEQETSQSRATAYVFGEMSAEDNARFEKELEGSAELRDEVAGVQEAIAALQTEFDSEAQGVSASDRARIETAMATRPASLAANAIDSASSHRMWMIALTVAASLLVLVTLSYPGIKASLESKQQVTQVLDADKKIADESKPVELEPEAVQDYSKSVEPQGTTDLSMEVAQPALVEELAASPGAKELAQTQFNSPKDVLRFPAEDVGQAKLDIAKSPSSETATRDAKPSSAPVSRSVRYHDQPRGSVVESDAKGSTAVTAMSIAPTAESAPVAGPVIAGAIVVDKSRAVKLFKQPGSGTPSGRANLQAPTLPARSLRSEVELTKSRHKLSVVDQEVSRLETSIAPEAESLGRLEGKDFGRDERISGDRFAPIVDNPFMKVGASPLSTFSIDVDTASYSKVRMYLMQHQALPHGDAVRIEELLNYFTYDYEPPKPTDEHPFAAQVAVSQCPWNADHRLARVAIKGKVIEEERPASNLVFLLDVSGSMNQPNKLPLVVDGMKMLTKQLGENDMVAMVVYAGAAGLVLDSTCGDDKEYIIDALDRLRAGGSTAGAQGIQLAYNVARDNFIPGGTNRVILCTDGDFNVGVTDTDELVKIAEENAKGNIFLSVLGFGSGNHNDAMMEKISNKGNGNYAFIDSKKEAQKVLVEQMGGTLVTIAKDVKIQVEFNPKEVASYRLIGYENRVLAAEDFNDDSKDAGEIGAGHTVTALYELVPQDDDAEITVPTIDVSGPEIDDLRYRKKSKLSKRANSGELLMLKLRYKQPEGTESTLIEVPVKDSGKPFNKMDQDFKFAGTVAAFGMLLRNSPHKGNATFAAVEEMAGDGIGQDEHGRRAEFVDMVRQAKVLSGEK